MNETTPVHGKNGDSVPLREYVERIFDERDKALQAAYTVLEQRLEALNELRQQVIQDRQEFVRTDVYEEKHEAIVKHMNDVDQFTRTQIREATAALDQRIDDLESWRLKATGVFLVLVPLAGVIGAFIVHSLGG